MVRAFLILFISTIAAADTAVFPEGVQFKMELSKTDFFQGEEIFATFAVYSKTDTLDIEVVKFPEFRGYWSENLVLRQGPIPLLPLGMTAAQEQFTNPFRTRILPGQTDPFEGKMKRGVVGSYLLTSMVGKTDISIEPMKIMVQGKTELSSLLPEIVTRPLPPVTPSKDAPFFSGAVGNFTFNVENPQIPFKKDEPIALRMNLQGEGNFQEINEIPLSLPKEIEVLSKKSYSQSSGQYAAKTFEVILTIHSPTSLTLPDQKFLFFNPSTKRYQQILFPQIGFTLIPATALPAPETANLNLEPEKTWSKATDLSTSLLFWLVQIGVGTTALSTILLEAIKSWNRQRVLKTSYLRKEKLTKTALLLSQKNALDFLKAAGDLTLDILAELTPEGAPWISRRELLQRAEKKWGLEARKQIESLIQSYEYALYSQEKKIPQDTDIFLKNLKHLVKLAS